MHIANAQTIVINKKLIFLLVYYATITPDTLSLTHSQPLSKVFLFNFFNFFIFFSLFNLIMPAYNPSYATEYILTCMNDRIKLPLDLIDSLEPFNLRFEFFNDKIEIIVLLVPPHGSTIGKRICLRFQSPDFKNNLILLDFNVKFNKRYGGGSERSVEDFPVPKDLEEWGSFRSLVKEFYFNSFYHVEFSLMSKVVSAIKLMKKMK